MSGKPVYRTSGYCDGCAFVCSHLGRDVYICKDMWIYLYDENLNETALLLESVKKGSTEMTAKEKVIVDFAMGLIEDSADPSVSPNARRPGC